MSRLIDEYEYQEKLARIPMELRTYRKAVEVAEDMPTVKAIPIEKLEQIKQEVKKWYWNHDIQELAKDPCVVDAMTDMFIRMLDKAIKEVNE